MGNLMSLTAMELPKIMYPSSEYIRNHEISSIYFIFTTYSLADAMTRAKPNRFSEIPIKNDKCNTPVERVFMIEISSYGNGSYIPTSSVPMTGGEPASMMQSVIQLQLSESSPTCVSCPAAEAPPATELSKPPAPTPQFPQNTEVSVPKKQNVYLLVESRTSL